MGDHNNKMNTPHLKITAVIWIHKLEANPHRILCLKKKQNRYQKMKFSALKAHFIRLPDVRREENEHL